jgi:hypothetical protein
MTPVTSLNVGFGEVDFTPVPPANEPDAFQVFDPVGFRAIAFHQGDEHAVFLTGDFFSFEQSLLDLTAEYLRDIAWLDPARILPAVSHCGGAPILFQAYVNQPCEHLRLFGQEKAFARAAAEAVRKAAADLQPSRLGFSAAPVEGVLYNRRSHDTDGNLVMSNFLLPYPRPELEYSAVDSNVYTLRVDAANDDPQPTPRAAALIFGCHALCNCDKQGHVSADYPGVARRVIENAWNVPVAFMQGALGNVVPIDRGGRTYERVGNSVGGVGLYALEQTVTTGDLRLQVDQSTVQIPLSVEEDLSETEPALAARAANHAEGHLRYGVFKARRSAATAPYTLTKVQLNGTTLLHLPGEVFVETAQAIRQASTADLTIVISGPTADVGYLCPPQAHREGGMEVQFTGVAAEAEAIIRRKGVEMVKRL